MYYSDYAWGLREGLHQMILPAEVHQIRHIGSEASFHARHALNELEHFDRHRFDLFVLIHTRPRTHGSQIEVRFVFSRWCPAIHDSSRGEEVVLSHVGTHKFDGSQVAMFYQHEITEPILLRMVGVQSEPLVVCAVANVERVVESHSEGDGVSSSCHKNVELKMKI